MCPRRFAFDTAIWRKPPAFAADAGPMGFESDLGIGGVWWVRFLKSQAAEWGFPGWFAEIRKGGSLRVPGVCKGGVGVVRVTRHSVTDRAAARGCSEMWRASAWDVKDRDRMEFGVGSGQQ